MLHARLLHGCSEATHLCATEGDADIMAFTDIDPALPVPCLHTQYECVFKLYLMVDIMRRSSVSIGYRCS